MATINIRIRDYSDEYSSVQANVTDLNMVDDTWANADGIVQGLWDAVGNITLGTLVESSFRQTADTAADERPASPYAQRELAARFFFQNAAGDGGYISVPAPDLANLDVLAGTDLLDLEDTEAAALVTWIEANVQVDGEAVTVDRAVIVGRSY